MTSTRAADSKRFWRQRVLYGLLLGASIAVLEFAYYYPLVSTSGERGAGLLASLLISWCGEGVLLASIVGFFEWRWVPRPLGVPRLALAVAIGSIAGVLGWQVFVQLVLRERFGFWLLRDFSGQPVSLASIALYHVWLMLLFGGLAAAVVASGQRHARMLAALRAAELERETSQRRLAEAQLSALEARIDPEFLFQTLSKLEQLYEADPQGADSLLEDLIVFLRKALADGRASMGASAAGSTSSLGEAASGALVL
jgi:hypothetical protein